MSRARLGRFVLSRRDGRAAAWVFDRLQPAHGRGERWRRALARRSPALARLALAEPTREQAELAEEVAAVLSDAGPAADPAGDWVLATPGSDDARGRLTVFPLAEDPDGTVRAQRVVKLRRSGPAGGSPADWDLSAEAEALAGLAEALPEPLRRTLPPVLDHRPAAASGGWEVLVLGALPGRSVYVDLLGFGGRRRADDHLHTAAGWLARFHAATRRSDSVWRPPEWESIAPAPGEPRPEWHRRLAAAVEEHPRPLAAGHGDFWARNLLTVRGDAGGVEVSGAVDWEHFRPAAPPFEDLFHFAWTYARGHAGWHRPPAAALELGFLRDTRLSRAIRRALHHHARETGTDAGALRDLLRVFLLESAGRTGPAGRSERETWIALYRTLEEAGSSAFSG